MSYISFRGAMRKNKNSNKSHHFTPIFSLPFKLQFKDFFFQCKQLRKASTSQAAGLNPSVKERKRRSEGEETKKKKPRFAFRAEMCWTRVLNINMDTCGLHHGHRDPNTVWTQPRKINPAGESRWKNGSVTNFSVILLWFRTSPNWKIMKSHHPQKNAAFHSKPQQNSTWKQNSFNH